MISRLRTQPRNVLGYEDNIMELVNDLANACEDKLYGSAQKIVAQLAACHYRVSLIHYGRLPYTSLYCIDFTGRVVCVARVY